MPRFKAYRSERLINVAPARYKVDWDAKTRSKFQSSVKSWMRQFWQFDVCLEEMPVPGTRLKCDLVNLTRMVIIEASGQQHVEFNKHFHNNNRWAFHHQIVRDEAKREWAESNGFVFVEIYPDDMPLTKEFFSERYGLVL
jgi:hypothetical protein